MFLHSCCLPLPVRMQLHVLGCCSSSPTPLSQANSCLMAGTKLVLGRAGAPVYKNQHIQVPLYVTP
jgi:hypothetical protein